MLRGAGWTIVEAETGQEAIDKAQQGIDLIVLDVNLPDFDGFEVCRRIRQNEATSRLPVLHLSATFVQDVHKVHGLESGADGYLTHPIEPPVLIATVNAFLRARQAEIDLRQSEARFKSVFDNAPNGVALINDALKFLDVNPAMCELIQRQRDEIVGHSIQRFVAPDSRGAVEESRAQLEQTGAWRGMLTLVRADGQTVDSHWNMSTHASPGLRLAIVSDITERIKYERERERLLESERTRAKPSNTPINSRTNSWPRCRTSCARPSMRSSAGLRWPEWAGSMRRKPKMRSRSSSATDGSRPR